MVSATSAERAYAVDMPRSVNGTSHFFSSGLGGVLATRYAVGKMPTGGSVWTFALMPE